MEGVCEWLKIQLSDIEKNTISCLEWPMTPSIMCHITGYFEKQVCDHANRRAKATEA